MFQWLKETLLALWTCMNNRVEQNTEWGKIFCFSFLREGKKK